MYMAKNRGMLVETKGGIIGKTINSKGLINGKIPVYAATAFKCIDGVYVPVAFSEKAILCEPASLTIKGFID
jgi:hypothetical protein